MRPGREGCTKSTRPAIRLSRDSLPLNDPWSTASHSVCNRAQGSAVAETAASTSSARDRKESVAEPRQPLSEGRMWVRKGAGLGAKYGIRSCTTCAPHAFRGSEGKKHKKSAQRQSVQSLLLSTCDQDLNPAPPRHEGFICAIAIVKSEVATVGEMRPSGPEAKLLRCHPQEGINVRFNLYSGQFIFGSINIQVNV